MRKFFAKVRLFFYFLKQFCRRDAKQRKTKTLPSQFSALLQNNAIAIHLKSTNNSRTAEKGFRGWNKKLGVPSLFFGHKEIPKNN